MAKANLTVQLDADIIRRAKVVAARRGTSVSALVAEETRYAEARERAALLMRAASSRGGRAWRRDELHER